MDAGNFTKTLLSPLCSKLREDPSREMCWKKSSGKYVEASGSCLHEAEAVPSEIFTFSSTFFQLSRLH